MCRTCYEDYGSPAIVTDATRAAADCIHRLYEVHGAGGHLHIVVDDWNLEDGDLDWCINKMESDPYGPVDPVERDCAHLLRAMTVEERASALAIEDGYLKS